MPENPFDVTEAEKFPESDQLAKLPVITFDILIDGRHYVMTTDHPALFSTVYNHPAEIDKHIMELHTLRSQLFEAYRQAVKARLREERQKKEWTSAVWKTVTESLESVGKTTLQKIDDEMTNQHGATIAELETKIQDAEDTEARYKEYHDMIKSRISDLKSIAERFMGAMAEYSGILSVK
jgi:hypothetical protein